MQEAAHSPLSAWESFYVIVGTSAAALTGLQFVVITLVADAKRPSTGEIGAFATPTIVHFCLVLLISGTLSAPWPGLTGPDVMFAVAGLAGIAYTALVYRRARKQTGYRPVFEDWFWHVILPLISYSALIAAAVILERETTVALFLVGGSAVLLLFIGIHNAWDTVTFVASGELARSASGVSPPAAEPSEDAT